MNQTTQSVLKIHKNDNVIVALRDLSIGFEFTVDDFTIEVQENIRAKHKVSARSFATDEVVIQYGIPVGKAIKPIRKGCAITTENVHHLAQAYDGKRSNYEWQMPDMSQWEKKTFQGVKRSDGQVGTANYWLVVPLVFCQNRNIETLRYALQDSLGYGQETHYVDLAQAAIHAATQTNSATSVDADSLAPRFPTSPIFPNVDGVKFITHSAGCGGTRGDALTLCKLLAGYIHHPNVAGATILSLGCQNAQISLLETELLALDPTGKTPVLWFEQQQYGEESAMMTEAITQTVGGIAKANNAVREPVPLSELRIGVECGGSDGFSGITANPLIGSVSDKVVAMGGTAILAEFPELCGVEQNLIDRCEDEQTSVRFIELMRAYEQHAKAVGASFDMNPSPGNIKDGLITDAMKSAGAALKGGSAPVSDVLDYTEVLSKKGLNLLCTPGNDVESTTALVGTGANLVLFSTGLGTPTGNPIVPVLKISSNTRVSQKMNDIIDLDAGSLVTSEKTMAELSNELFNLCIDTASGAYVTKATRLGQDDFIPWKRGVSL
jgi:altronate hydrolase